jgi:LemA protein
VTPLVAPVRRRDTRRNTEGRHMELARRTRLIVALALVALGASGCGYNTLVSEREAVDGAWGEVQSQLQRRNDLIPNLVETVKGYAAQEERVLREVTEARSRVGGATTPAQTIEASNQLSNALSRLLVVVERYPELKSNQNFLRLQDELAGTENRLGVARKRYNDAVQRYNTSAKRFPTNLVAMAFGFQPREYFEAPEAAQAVPRVDFQQK